MNKNHFYFLRKVLLSLALVAITANSQNFETTHSGIEAHADGLVVNVQCYSGSIIRVVKYPEGSAPEKHSYSVVMNPIKANFSVKRNADESITLSTDSVCVIVNLRDGRITFANKQGINLLAEKAEGTQFTPVKYGEYDTYTVRQAFRLDADEIIYGLGQHQHGKMNQRNQVLSLRQTNTEIAIPYWQSVKGYGLFWDNTSPTTFTDNSIETAFDSQCGECSDYYFLYGGNADGVLRNMRLLTGGVPMNALWTYGFWQSKERYQSQEEITNVVKRYRELQVPLDCIVQDWQYWGIDSKNWNAVEFNNPNFPDAAKMIKDIHDMNVHIAISVWPSFGRNTEIYKELKEKNMLLNFNTWPSEAQVYDPFNPEGRRIYWERMKKNMLDIGIDGWWLDATEPEFSDKDNCLNQSTHDGLYRSIYNAFPIASVGGVYDNQRKTTNDKRVYILTRSAFAGQQRYAACTWSGDIHATWQVLKNQIPAGLNFSVCGIPYWNTDIGGFVTWESYRNGVNDPAYRELYVRWLQFGTFCPLMRSHGTNTPREIYQFGEPGSWEFETIAKYIRLRYSLIPYIFSTAWSVTSEGNTMMRPLFMDFAGDRTACTLGDQYLFGNAIMVAPVVEPMNADGSAINENSAQTRRVYLPQGSDWYDFWTGEKINGGKWIDRKVTIAEMPIYIKAGSIVPMAADGAQYAAQIKWNDMGINIYAGADAEFSLYSDEGDGYGYEHGDYNVIPMSWCQDSRTLTIGTGNGSYKGMTNKRKFRVTLIDGGKKITKTINYTGKSTKVKF